MRALVFSDLQATDGHERCFNDTTKSLQLWRVDKFMQDLHKIYKEYRCDALWDLGDTTDDRGAIPVPVIDLLCDALEPFIGDWNIKLVGNHEQWLRSTGIHAGKMFRKFFHVVESCEAIQCGKVNILCVSYHDNTDPVVKFLKMHSADKCAILLGHFQIAGCQMNSGIAATGISRDLLKFVKLGLLGHIHKPQTMGKLHYVGSPFQQNWGESGENKRVAIVDIDGSEVSLTFIPLTDYPKYRQVSLPGYIEGLKTVTEDRYKVVLTSVAETEQFYSDPWMKRADEAIYAYEQSNDTGQVSTPADTDIPRSKQDILAKYMVRVPPSNLGITLDMETVFQFGESIMDSK